MKGKGTNEISSEEIGEMVLSELFKLDEVAYVRFASVYRQFEEVGEFVSVIEKLSEKNS
jgi:transcriptional repressor NrdR